MLLAKPRFQGFRDGGPREGAAAYSRRSPAKKEVSDEQDAIKAFKFHLAASSVSVNVNQGARLAAGRISNW